MIIYLLLNQKAIEAWESTDAHVIVCFTEIFISQNGNSNMKFSFTSIKSAGASSYSVNRTKMLIVIISSFTCFHQGAILADEIFCSLLIIEPSV